MQKLIRAARQLVQTDRALAGEALAPGRRLPAPAASEPAPAPPQPGMQAAPAQQVHPAQGARAGPPRQAAPPPARSSSPPGGPIPPPDASRWANNAEAMRRQGELDKIAEELCQCRSCRLQDKRSSVVPGEGSPMAEIVFIGEGPGEEEDRLGRPFVGRAGELLTRMIAAMGLTRSDVYIANVVKCRPPGNRPPLADEAGQCADFLRRQLLVIRPKVIVALGNPAVHALLNTTEGITRLRGRWRRLPTLDPELADVKVMPTFHPAYVLRSYTEDNRKMVWLDLQEVMRELHLQPGKGGRRI